MRANWRFKVVFNLSRGSWLLATISLSLSNSHFNTCMKAREYTSRQPHHTKYKIKEIQGENLFRLKLELICNLYSGIIKGQNFFSEA